MSHNKERAEKICLNCGTHLNGRFCHVCGQENTEPKETVWALVSHFFNDITHFDGKFFSTGKYLLTKPGFLSSEYLKGRRASYLHPIRMYVFTSAFFFIIFFSLFNVGEIIKGEQKNEEKLKELKEASTGLKEELPGTRDTVLKTAINGAIAGIDKHAALLEKEIEERKQQDSLTLAKTKRTLDSAGIKIPGLTDSLLKRKIKSKFADEDELKISPKAKITVQKANFGSKLAYDSVQAKLPEKKRDGWFTRLMVHKTAKLNSKWKEDNRETMSLFAEKFMHTLPQALFVSMPIFALVLLMLYARRKFYYVDHGIFTIHLYCAAFIMLLFYFGVDKIEASIHGSVITYIIKVLIMLGILFYLYKAMRRFYGQGRTKTIIKFLILLVFSLFLYSFLAGAFVFLSLMQFS